MLKRGIFSPAEKAGWLTYSRTGLIERGKGWIIDEQGDFRSSFCFWTVLQKPGSKGCCSSWAGKAPRQDWKGSLDYQCAGCSPSPVGLRFSWQKLLVIVVLRLWKIFARPSSYTTTYLKLLFHPSILYFPSSNRDLGISILSLTCITGWLFSPQPSSDFAWHFSAGRWLPVEKTKQKKTLKKTFKMHLPLGPPLPCCLPCKTPWGSRWVFPVPCTKQYSFSPCTQFASSWEEKGGKWCGV